MQDELPVAAALGGQAAVPSSVPQHAAPVQELALLQTGLLALSLGKNLTFYLIMGSGGAIQLLSLLKHT